MHNRRRDRYLMMKRKTPPFWGVMYVSKGGGGDLLLLTDDEGKKIKAQDGVCLLCMMLCARECAAVVCGMCKTCKTKERWLNKKGSKGARCLDCKFQGVTKKAHKKKKRGCCFCKEEDKYIRRGRGRHTAAAARIYIWEGKVCVCEGRGKL
jgi:hypothetical protein